MKKGFSLIELLTVIAIIGIMTSVSLVSLMENKKRKEVEVAVREVAAAVREAQNYALTGKGAQTGSSICTAYTFFWNGNTADYGFHGTGGASCTSPFATNYALRGGVSFSNSGSFDMQIPFGDLGGSTIPINISKGNYTYFVCVYPSGRVDEVTRGTACP